jgi:hypothetical protein
MVIGVWESYQCHHAGEGTECGGEKKECQDKFLSSDLYRERVGCLSQREGY